MKLEKLTTCFEKKNYIIGNVEVDFINKLYIYRALIVPNWSKWQCLNPRNLTKNDHR